MDIKSNIVNERSVLCSLQVPELLKMESQIPILMATNQNELMARQR